jgi:NAD(P)-dependent dehydrogenase (short-subunit alcohol dehydrogenase family)
MKRALVTGGAKRVGRAISKALAKAGWEVIIHYNTSRDEAERLALEINGSVIQGDLSNNTTAESIIRQAGNISLLVNNASLFEDDAFGKLDYTLFDRHMTVNFLTPVRLMEAFTAQCEKGSIINIIDQRVLKPTPLLYSYALSKEALWAATKMTAQALAPKIRVNAIGPGPTMKNERQEEAAFKKQYLATLLQHPSYAADIAKAVLFLADNESITGQMIAVDSGQHLAWKTEDVWD